MPSDCGAAALELLRLGYSVIPVKSNKKGGAYVNWAEFQRRRPTEQEVIAWWKKWPDAGVAIVTGAISGCIVMDLDRHGDDDGVEVAKSMHGWEPEGPLARTGGGGMHAYYRHPGGTVPNGTGIVPGVDLRGDGGFVYAPPSPHPSGECYEWIEQLVAPADLPAPPKWLLNGMVHDKVPVADDLEAVLRDGVDQGQRNATAARLAGRCLALGMTALATHTLLLAWNGRNRPPLPPGDIDRVVESISRRDAMRRGETEVAEAPSAGERALALQALSDRFHIPLDDIIRVEGTRALYRFVVGGVPVDVPARDVSSQWSWRREIIACSERVPVSLGAKATPGWDYYLQQMLRLARHIEPGEEATTFGELRGWVASYLLTAEPRADGEESLSANDPRLIGGRTFIHAEVLRSYVNMICGARVEQKTLVQLLSLYGFERRNVNIRLSRGARTTRSMWTPPAGFLNEEEN